ncbi:histidine phosphatase family protein [Fibrobacter sp. UWB4]|uniref:histidine phosphatase family protein n=1 Tax=Fibrobacter sp. UWB4 TaxID=1964356 RepID=UPI000B520FEF|nr:histidine phosphatase family protein [Fibrobacter sp. UWB4]OWV15308.1 histidine phosphatase family protein [Fibrobacter sp. UWB4]
MTNDFVQLSDFFAQADWNSKIYLLLRHAERNHITPGDKDFGAHVGLTDRGRRQAVALGKMIPAIGDAVYFSSPVGRCMETAKCISEGRKLAGFGNFAIPGVASGAAADSVNVTPLNELGDFFVRDVPAYEQTLREGFYEGICKWLESGEHGAFWPLHERAEQMREMMFEKAQSRFNVFVTHDAWVVPCLSHFCGLKFEPKCWMNFLTGLAFEVPEKGNVKVTPVTALETGWLHF